MQTNSRLIFGLKPINLKGLKWYSQVSVNSFHWLLFVSVRLAADSVLDLRKFFDLVLQPQHCKANAFRCFPKSSCQRNPSRSEVHPTNHFESLQIVYLHEPSNWSPRERFGRAAITHWPNDTHCQGVWLRPWRSGKAFQNTRLDLEIDSLPDFLPNSIAKSIPKKLFPKLWVKSRLRFQWSRFFSFCEIADLVRKKHQSLRSKVSISETDLRSPELAVGKCLGINFREISFWWSSKGSNLIRTNLSLISNWVSHLKVLGAFQVFFTEQFLALFLI